MYFHYQPINPFTNMLQSQRLPFFLYLTISLSVSGFSSSLLSLSDALLKSDSESKNIILNYDADWCLPCQFMKENVLSRTDVETTLDADFVYVDVEIDDPTSSSWLDAYSYACLPSFLVIDKSGEIIEELAGTASVPEFIDFMDRHNIHRESVDKNPAPIVKVTESDPVEVRTKTPVAMMNNVPVTPKVKAKYTIAVGAFSVKENAINLKERIEKVTGQTVTMKTDSKGLNRLTLGRFLSKNECNVIIATLKKNKIDHYIKGL